MVGVTQILRQQSSIAIQTVRGLQVAFQVIRQDASVRLVSLKRHIERELPVMLRLGLVRSLWNVSQKRLDEISSTAGSVIAAMQLDSTHTIEQVEIKAADGYPLDGVSLFHPDYKSTTVYFTGVTERWQTKLDILLQLHKMLKTNIVCCSYRGTTENTPFDPKEDLLISDGLHIMRHVIGQRPPGHEFRIHGKSLGGAVGLIVAAALAKRGVVVDMISESSFRNLGLALRHASPVLGRFLASIANRLQFQFDAEKAVLDLRGRLIVLYRERDFVIPEPATLKAIFDSPQPLAHSLKSLHIIKLDRHGREPNGLHPLLEAHCRRLSIGEIEKIAAIFHETALCAN